MEKENIQNKEGLRKRELISREFSKLIPENDASSFSELEELNENEENQEDELLSNQGGGQEISSIFPRTEKLLISLETIFLEWNSQIKSAVWSVCTKLTCSNFIHLWQFSWNSISPLLAFAFKNFNRKNQLENETLYIIYSSILLNSVITIIFFIKWGVINSSSHKTKYSGICLLLKGIPLMLYQLSLYFYVSKMISLYFFDFPEQYFNFLTFIIIFNFILEPSLLFQLYLIYLSFAMFIALIWCIFIFLIGICTGILENIKLEKNYQSHMQRQHDEHEIKAFQRKKDDKFRFEPITKLFSKTSEQFTCIICLLEFKENEEIIELPCNGNHIFHSHCLKSWWTIKTECPICREGFLKE